MTGEGDEETVNLIRRQPVDAAGTCTRCDNKCENESMKCFGCEEYYHVLNCANSPKPQVTPTFNKGWDNMVQNYVNIQYICDACIHDKKLKNDIVVSNRMCVMEENLKLMKENMEKKFIALQESVGKLVNQKNEYEINNPALPAPAMPPGQQVQSTANRSVIVIKKKKNGPKHEIEKIHQAAVKTNASVSNAYHNNEGDAVIVLENQESRESMLPVIQDEIDPEQFTVVTPKQRQQTITIINIAREYTKDELLERVKSQNTWRFSGIDVNETNFKVIYFKKQFKNPEFYKAVVRVSNELRHRIEIAGDKLNIGVTSCAVYDDFFVKRCNRCQRLNHWKDACPDDIPVVCGRCAGNHETLTCHSEDRKCVNCSQAGYTEISHETSSLNCRAYKEAQQKLQSTINYYKDRPKNSRNPNL